MKIQFLFKMLIDSTLATPEEKCVAENGGSISSFVWSRKRLIHACRAEGEEEEDEDEMAQSGKRKTQQLGRGRRGGARSLS